ncbi:putative nucleotidyltransferase substrate binding domain-containing protein [Reinekea marinisedimentorum]|uniref:CBS domain-containing protein n=1 Tax=Reinekea marinisedimentorum TaxID=230495 RepID=A0A4R3I8C2_9GAMM|nr:putative nucleotidyltransferase substrate binding domain-containing protein [Reinekea marinisedimentorum]TCS40437.1 CBS domain-containing protein [Reinekea marinisedimentorum]
MENSELNEISNFLIKHPPFDELEPEQLAGLSQQVEVAYYRAGAEILKLSDPIQDLYVIRSGAVEMYKRDGELYNRLTQGEVFGHSGLLMNRRVRLPAVALEDTLLYCIPAQLFHKLFDENDYFADFFDLDGGAQLRQAISANTDSNDLSTVKVKNLQLRDVVTVSKNTSVRDAAVVMTEEMISSVLVTDPDLPVPDDPEDDDGQVVGIITDQDLRTRLLAADLPATTAVKDVMTTDLIVIDENTYVFEVVLKMLRQNVHHLPIVHRRKPVGVVSLSDILLHESQSSILFVRGIFSQQSVDELITYAEQLPAVFLRQVKEDANSHMIGSAMSVIGRCFKQRLLELAENELGPPPVKYCLLALGSMARNEQLIITDQDNALILDEAYNPEQHEDYFIKLATFLTDGLNACGYSYCSGDIMASNGQWRKTLSEWKALFDSWFEQPSPKALLHSSIFFDLDGVAGHTRWADELKRHIARKAKDNPRFLAAMARNALNRTPPLAFFKGFVVEKDGEHKNSINLKRRGTAPLTDVIRVHALAIGSRSLNSFERIDDIIAADILPPGKARDLSDALEYIAMVRIIHQAEDIEAGRKPDNNIEPESLSSFEKRNLKEAFQVLSNAQNFLKFRYTGGHRPGQANNRRQ